jgi:hypothetical protein
LTVDEEDNYDDSNKNVGDTEVHKCQHVLVAIVSSIKRGQTRSCCTTCANKHSLNLKVGRAHNRGKQSNQQEKKKDSK